MTEGISLAADKLWFDYKNYREQVRFRNLSGQDRAIIEQLDKEGCYLYKNAISDDLIEKINLAIDAWMITNVSKLAANKREDGTYPRLIGLHQNVPAINALFSDAITQKLQNLLAGHNRSLCTSITFLQGSQQPLHRDIPVFRLAPGNLYFRIWFALEETTPENGTITGIKGGHRVGVEKHKMAFKFYRRFEEVPEQDPHAWRHYQETLKRHYEAAGLKEEHFTLSSGDLLIWHPLFPHSGSRIENKKASRRSVVLHVSVAPPSLDGTQY